MKDEEMAEKYLKEKLEERKDKFVFELPEVYVADVKQAFLAGLKAGRPQWHEVADGLPISDKDKYYFVVDKMNVYMIARFYEGKWSNYSVIDDVIAWCEIPQFNSEG